MGGGCPEDTGGTLEKNGIRGTLGPPQAEIFGILIDFLGGKQCFQCISQPFGGQNSPNFSPTASLNLHVIYLFPFPRNLFLFFPPNLRVIHGRN